MLFESVRVGEMHCRTHLSFLRKKMFLEVDHGSQDDRPKKLVHLSVRACMNQDPRSFFLIR